MMKRLAVLVCFCVAVGAHAASDTASLWFRSISLAELSRVVIGETLGKSFVLSDAVLRDESVVTVDMRQCDALECFLMLRRILRGQGFEAIEQDGVFYVRKKGEPELTDFLYYRPKHRTVRYISDMVRTFFPVGRFSFERSGPTPLSSGQAVRTTAGTQSQAHTGPGSTGGAGSGGGLGLALAGSTAAGVFDRVVDSFVFRGTAEEVERLRKLLIQVDTPAGEVLVRVAVYEVTHSVEDGSAFQLALSLLGGKLGANVTGPLLGNSVTLNVPYAHAVYSVLNADSRFRSLSAPSLRVVSGSNAHFEVGSQTPTLGNVTLTAQGQSMQSINYLQSGVILDLLPVVFEDSVSLTVTQQLSAFVRTTTGVNDTPTLNNRRLSSVVSAKSGDVIVLGGLEDERASQDESGLPFMPRWMRSRSDSRSQQELLLVLHVQRL